MQPWPVADDIDPVRIAEDNSRWTVFGRERAAEQAFREYRIAGFPYRRLSILRCMLEINRLAATPTEKLRQTQMAYQVADTYHPHRFHARSNGKRTPVEAFNDDELLKRAIQFKFSGQRPMTDILDVLAHIRGTQACYNFRPGFALYAYRQYITPGATVLDTCAGYGGRLVGFIASGCAGQYVGVDPCSETHAGNSRMASDLEHEDNIRLHHMPVEDLPPGFMANECDFAFTSPPYFKKEQYSNEPTQSFIRYPDPESWQEGFLSPMMRVQYTALKPSKYALIIVANVRIRGVEYPLIEWTKEAGRRVGFVFHRQDNFLLNARLGGQKSRGIAGEAALLFHKEGVNTGDGSGKPSGT